MRMGVHADNMILRSLASMLYTRGDLLVYHSR